MWRVVEEINNITGKSIWIIEKKKGLFIKSWSRDYPVGNSNIWSPVKSFSKSVAFERMKVLAEGDVMVKGEILEL